MIYISLGSNLDNPLQQLTKARTELEHLPQTQLLAYSSLYRSKAIGGPAQPDYLNAVAKLTTCLPAMDLLNALQAIEAQHGRVRAERFGPRTLDLDILLYNDMVCDTPRLTLPHPRLAERAFVLYPLAEIAPDLRLPDGRSIADLHAAVAGTQDISLLIPPYEP